LGKFGGTGIDSDLNMVIIGVLEQFGEQIKISGQGCDVKPVGIEGANGDIFGSQLV